MVKTNITPQHKELFEALTSGDFSNFALFSCTCNGTPTSAIVSINQVHDEFLITPLFVAITPDMVLRDHEGEPA